MLNRLAKQFFLMLLNVKRKILKESFAILSKTPEGTDELSLINALLKLDTKNMMRIFENFTEENKWQKKCTYLVLEDFTV